MNFTAAELRALADNMALPATKACAALREYADLKEAAEKGVTEEVLRPQFERFCRDQCSQGANFSEWYWQIFQAGGRAAELSAQTPEGFCPKCNTRIGVHGGCDCGFCSPKLSAQESKPEPAIHPITRSILMRDLDKAIGEAEGFNTNKVAELLRQCRVYIHILEEAAPSVSAQDASPKDGLPTAQSTTDTPP